MFSSEVKIITVASKDSCNHHHHHHHNYYQHRNLISGTTTTTTNYNKIYQQQNQHRHHQRQQSPQHQKQQEQQIKNQKNNHINSNINLNNNNTSNNNNNYMINNNQRKKDGNNSSYSYQLNNRKKHQQQQINHNNNNNNNNNNNSNNNKIIKNQNICSSNEHAYNHKSTSKAINNNNIKSSSNSSNSSSSSNSNCSISVDQINSNNINRNCNSNNNSGTNSNNNNKDISNSTKLKSSRTNYQTKIISSSPSTTHLKEFECTVVTLHKNPVEACIVMNGNSIPTTSTPPTITATATSSSATKLNNKNATSTASSLQPSTTVTTKASTPTVAVTSLAPTATVQPPSYSLDFLHSVGMQMTSVASNRVYSNPSTRKTVTMPVFDMNSCQTLTTACKYLNGNSNHQQHQQNQSRPTFKEYNFEMPLNAHQIRPYCHFIYQQHGYHHGNSMNPHYPILPPAATAIHHQYHTATACNQFSNSRHPHAKKLWHWQTNNMKKCSSNGASVNKFGSSSSINTYSNGTSSQSYSRTRNQNKTRNNSNLDTNDEATHSVNRRCYIGNSRSPTPSPKSESPSLYKTQSSQSAAAVSSNVNNNDGSLWNNNSSSTAGITPTNSTSSTDIQNGNVSLNGYDSDSSHSSYRYNELDFHSVNVQNSATTANAGGYPYHHYHHHHHHHHQQQIPSDITSLINFPTYSLEDNSITNPQLHYYGSQQNLTFWNNSGINAVFGSSNGGGGVSGGGNGPHTIYATSSTSETASLDATAEYLENFPIDEESTTLSAAATRKSQPHNRIYRARRQMYQTYRPYNFNETNVHTPPDKFLAKAHLIETKTAPSTLLNSSKWDNLSKCVWDKFMLAQQTEYTFRKKMYLWRFLYLIVKDVYPKYGLYLVGSTISGFGADTSDVDMCLVSRSTNMNIDPRIEAMYNLNNLKEYLLQTGLFDNFNLIEAKVPILRFKDRVNYLEVDLNFNNCVGIRNTHLLHCYSQLDWRLRPLVLVTKLWAQYHNINNAKNMTISSYSLALMVIHFLQYAVQPPVLPCLHTMFPEKFQIILKSNDFGYVDMTEDIGTFKSDNTQTLGELFLQFLGYYSIFDYTQYAISVRTGTILPIEICRQAKSIKNDIHQWKELCIEEPFDLTNTARSVYDCETFERVKSVFITSWKLLSETLDLNSIFQPFYMAVPATMLTSNTMSIGTQTNSTTTTEGEEEPSTVNVTSTNNQSATIIQSTKSASSSLSSSTSSSNDNDNNNNKNTSNNNQVPLKITPSVS